MRNHNNLPVDPFTRTPGVAGKAFIDMHYADRVITEFINDESSKYVYKIVGLRGSGKTVAYAKILNMFREIKGWLVYTLSAAGNPTETLIAKLSHEQFIDAKDHQTSFSGSLDAGGNIGIVKGNASITVTESVAENKDYFSPEATLDEMLLNAKSNGYKILVGIDDISRTDEMVKFLSIIGKNLIEGNTSLYLICTGLSKNIEEFENDPNLTFFKRSDTIEISSLDKYEIADKYSSFLGVTSEKAVEMAKFVNGYAYAYQVLGTLYFSRNEETEDEILSKFDKILFQDSYDLIWKSLTSSEKELVKIILNTPSNNVKDIKLQMTNGLSFPVLRDRLIKKHIVNSSERGVLRIDLPRFKEYVELWG